jgi:hypothetical protein
MFEWGTAPHDSAEPLLFEPVGRRVVLGELFENDLFLLFVHCRPDGGSGEHAGHQPGGGDRVVARYEREVDRRLLAREGVHVRRKTLESLGDTSLVELVEAVEEQMFEVVRMPAGSSCDPAGTATVIRTVPEPGRGHSSALAPDGRMRSTGPCTEISSEWEIAGAVRNAVQTATARMNANDTRRVMVISMARIVTHPPIPLERYTLER